ncbi:MAG: protein-glutamate O-methyltransferase CheR [Candidatus Omnitrophota bacterium]
MKDNTSENFIEFKDLSPEELRAFNMILNNIYLQRGIDFRQYRPKCLRRRVVVGMYDANVKDFCAYLDFLNKNPQQYDRLLDRITINVSEFFRNPETFQAIRKKVIPAIVERKKKITSYNIRIWSAGCATGEEPYSLAILFKETLQELGQDIKINIIATDIDKEALKKAKIGCYGSNDLKELTDRQTAAYFDKNDDKYCIKDQIKMMVKFMNHNMISDKPPSAIDLILCRNVIIYFNKELQNKVYANFHRALVPLGFLVAGKTESLMDVKEDFFSKVDLGERILQKKTDRKNSDENI